MQWDCRNNPCHVVVTPFFCIFHDAIYQSTRHHLLIEIERLRRVGELDALFLELLMDV